MALEVNSAAPLFKVKTNGGEEISLSDYKGKWLVLYFYPKDNTPGCTKEACSFRDNMEDITKLEAVVIGVSPDSVASHDKFVKKLDLNFLLASDEDNSISLQYGVWIEKNRCGKKSFGVERTTFIIDKEGMIQYIFSKVKADGHALEVIEKLKELMQGS